jgi:hypothetical protein
MMQSTEQAWDRTRVEAILANNKALQMRALVALYEAQTPTEQAWNSTVVANGAGFNKNDAEILSSFAEQLTKRGFLTGKQMILLRKKLPKYWRQIIPLISPEVEKQMQRQEAQQKEFGTW